MGNETQQLTRDAVFRSMDGGPDVELVRVPEWGGHVHVRSMTGRERDQYEAAFIEGKAAGMNNARGRMVALCACNEDGTRLFSDVDAVKLGDMPAGVLDRIVDVAMRLSRLTAQDVEELAGNSGGAQSADSGSD